MWWLVGTAINWFGVLISLLIYIFDAARILRQKESPSYKRNRQSILIGLPFMILAYLAIAGFIQYGMNIWRGLFAAIWVTLTWSLAVALCLKNVKDHSDQ